MSLMQSLDGTHFDLISEPEADLAIGNRAQIPNPFLKFLKTNKTKTK